MPVEGWTIRLWQSPILENDSNKCRGLAEQMNQYNEHESSLKPTYR